MKRTIALFCLAATASLLSSCVSRTTTTGHDDRVVDKKTLWIWQKEFRNPK
ncbi:hypothetical protein [Pontiella sulfatireligans]|uniref:Uncharacterized protein n=1 Tax=Pontiella sulfatireligans TaxID=2750658 RepID=A0A6C2UQG9_9BACT|nr:hypothetical protein [Pontiella sulfatireligans]VGO21547.1 hypothetical protein SCARR_03621 [Pontiella sulfatireligans]